MFGRSVDKNGYQRETKSLNQVHMDALKFLRLIWSSIIDMHINYFVQMEFFNHESQEEVQTLQTKLLKCC